MRMIYSHFSFATVVYIFFSCRARRERNILSDDIYVRSVKYI